MCLLKANLALKGCIFTSKSIKIKLFLDKKIASLPFVATFRIAMESYFFAGHFDEVVAALSNAKKFLHFSKEENNLKTNFHRMSQSFQFSLSIC